MCGGGGVVRSGLPHFHASFGPAWRLGPADSPPRRVPDQTVGAGSVTLDNVTAFHGHNSVHVVGAGTGFTGTANRGLGNEGLVFAQGEQYDG